MTRILFALAAMAGILAASRLPRPIYRAVLRPLRAAEAAASRFTGHMGDGDTAEARRLRRRLAALQRAIGRLIRRLLEPGPPPLPARLRKVHGTHATLAPFVGRTEQAWDTS